MLKTALRPLPRLFNCNPLLAPLSLHPSRSFKRSSCAYLRYVAAASYDTPTEIQFVLGRYRPRKSLTFKGWRQLSRVPSQVNQVEVDVMCEGTPEACSADELEELQNTLAEDAQEVVRLALALRAKDDPGYKLPRNANLSMVLCDDDYIRSLNLQYRGKDYATDVLSFEMPDELDHKIHLPVKLLGDLVISMDTSLRQAQERQYSLLDEARVLLVHGVLHLCGYDHERGQEALDVMARAEQDILSALGWQGSGLISAAGADVHEDLQEPSSSSMQQDADTPAPGNDDVAAEPPGIVASDTATRPGGSNSNSSSSSGGGGSSTDTYIYRSSDVELVAIDMDGTLLNGRSQILPSSAKAIRAALDMGVRVVLATGKARPAAIKACELAGLAGDDLLVSHRTPGVFLQGLAVHGLRGRQLTDAQLPDDVVADAFAYAQAHDLACVAFLGDACATLRMTQELTELHTRYYEPEAQVHLDVASLLQAGPVKKILYMTRPEVVTAQLQPHWSSALHGRGAGLLQAVPDMLELVPEGVNKWQGLQVLLDHLGVSGEGFMAIGDGGNDLEMVANAGIGVAMGNAVLAVKDAASLVVASNDEDGIAEAFERFVL